jgi:hypothetical protein
MFLLVLLALGTVVEPAAPSPLTSSLVARKTELLVGEPTKVEVTWSSTAALEVSTEHLQMWLDDGQGARVWSEARDARDPIGVTLRPPQTLTPGSTIKTSYVIGATGSMTSGYRLAFPKVGRYRLTAKYTVDSLSASSNTVVLRTDVPSGRDGELFERVVRVRPEIVSAQWWLLIYGGLESIFERYGSSTYLGKARLLFREMKVRDAILSAPDSTPYDAPIQGTVPQALDDLAKEDLGGSVFEEDRLVLLAQLRDETGRPAEAAETWKEIVKRYPDGTAAHQARRRLGLPLDS